MTVTFLPLLKAIGLTGAYAFYAIAAAISLPFVWLTVGETKAGLFGTDEECFRGRQRLAVHCALVTHDSAVRSPGAAWPSSSKPRICSIICASFCRSR